MMQPLLPTSQLLGDCNARRVPLDMEAERALVSLLKSRELRKLGLETIGLGLDAVLE